MTGRCCRPLAGTRRRGRTLEEDCGLEKDLMADDKERSEHIMLVDLGRNDVGKVKHCSDRFLAAPRKSGGCEGTQSV